MTNLIILFTMMLFPVTEQQKSVKLESIEESVVPLGDPFILLHNDVYYAYGTNANEGIEVYSSADLQSWKKEDNLALKSANSWGDRWFWAPEVYYIKEKGKFFMYYTANEHICVATSDSPLGPFVQDQKEPMLPQEKTIDNSLFIDDDGTPYLYFDRFNDGLNIWVARMKSDLKTIDTSSMKPCIHVSQAWEEVWPRVNEGPFVIKHGEFYYMTYSANSYESQHYGIGYAISNSPEGPWVKHDQNPVLQMPNSLVGVGHGALFKDKNGQLKIVFHAHHSEDKIHPRAMHIADVIFSNDQVPILKISSKIQTPILH